MLRENAGSGGQLKVDCDLSLDIDGLTVFEIRTVLPLLHSIQCGLRKQRIARNQLQIADGSILCDRRAHDDRSLYVLLSGLLGILRPDFLDQLPGVIAGTVPTSGSV